MSPKTAVRLGLMEDNEAPFTGLSFRKNEDGSYDYREGRAISFVGRTLHTTSTWLRNANAWGAASGGDERYA